MRSRTFVQLYNAYESFYLRQGGCVFTRVCSFVYLFVKLIGLLRNYRSNLFRNFTEWFDIIQEQID